MKDEKIIYTNPLLYYSKAKSGQQKNQFNEVITETLIQGVDFKENVTRESYNYKSLENLNKYKNNDLQKNSGISDHCVNNSNLIPNYSYNSNSICGSTAAAMLLMYMQFEKKLFERDSDLVHYVLQP